MSIRIFSKKSFAIGPGAQRGSSTVDIFQTVPLSFQDMPEKYENDPTFKLAVKAGDIEIVNQQTVKAIEAAPEKVVDPSMDEEVETVEKSEEEIASYKESLKKMNTEEVKAEAEKYGAEFVEDDKLSANKKRVLEAYKLFQE